MKTIYFVRHSIRDFTNKNNQEAPLTLDGSKHAEALISFFKDKTIEKIYASPYVRTLQTIQPTADFLNLEIATHSDLRERAVGKWVDDFPSFAKKQWQDFDYHLPNGESFNQVKNRLLPVYYDILNQPVKNCIICGHGTALAILFHHLTQGQFTYQEFEKMQMPDIFKAEYEQHALVHFMHLNIKN
ncbi:histidine phosphatase family protein [Enterococcus saccharolyticus]|uniref:Phosphoglycerate kinase n=1 Tax=Candidatus Enterococcus willemsii TaxID=1857215 RepID=A0ABQ6YZR4_9ENTE|nr:MULTISPECIES: histidine phosphatase family protein [Enterococcus]KAF1303318.1 phosphoglycerate kinase [Enterococcus sp. CU12B]MCD5001712.1 histidine phosphatase family protein [Enterococcus saccharolyticus]